MATEKIANRQLWFILFILRTTIVLSFLPVLTSADALQDAWISALFIILGSLIIVFLISLLDTRFPQLTIIEYSQKLLGSKLGKAFSLIFLWIFLQITVLELRIYTEMLVTAFLPNTPMLFIAGTMVFAAGICIYLGIETLARATDLLFMFFVLMIIAIILIPLTKVEINNIQPVLARGWRPVYSGMLTPLAFMIQFWVLGMLSPLTVEPCKTIKTALSSVAVSLLVLVIISFIVIITIGAEEGSRAVFPVLAVLRSIEVSEFLERTELFIVFAWGFGLFVSLTCYLYCGAKGVSQLLNLNDYRHLIWPMSIIWIFLSLHSFEDMFELYEFLKPEVFAPYGFILIFAPLIILYSAYCFKLIKEKMLGDSFYE